MSNSLKHNSIFLTFIGAAGSGKTTLSEMLRKEFPESILRSVSATSRVPRQGEKNTVDYYFLTRDEFEKKAKAGEFFEWEETHGNLYGTPRSELLRAQDSNRDLILDIDIRGALSFKKEYPKECTAILLLPPSPNVLKERLKSRNTNDSDLQVRMTTAKHEYEIILDSLNQLDYVVVNENLESSYAEIKSIYISEKRKISRIFKAELEGLCKI